MYIPTYISIPANWRLDLPLPMILLGVRACVPCMVQVPVPVQVFLTCFNSGHFDFIKTFPLHSHCPTFYEQPI